MGYLYIINTSVVQHFLETHVAQVKTNVIFKLVYFLS